MLFTLSNWNGLFDVPSGKGKLGLELVISSKIETNSTLYWACDYLPYLKLTHDSERGPWFCEKL